MAYIKFSQESINVDNVSDRYTVSYTSEQAVRIKAETLSIWIKNVSVNTLKQTVSFDVDENNFGSERTGYIDLSADLGIIGETPLKLYSKLTVIQSANSKRLTVTFTPDKLTLSNTAQSAGVEYTIQNGNVTSVSSDSYWITTNYDSNTIVVNVEENTGNNTRTGQVNLFCSNTESVQIFSFSVEQLGVIESAEFIWKDITDKRLTLPSYSSGNQYIYFELKNGTFSENDYKTGLYSNGTFIPSTFDWLETGSYSANSIQFRIKENNDVQAREAYIQVGATNSLGTTYDYLNIIQEAFVIEPKVEIQGDNQRVSQKEGETFQIHYTSEGVTDTYVETIIADWISVEGGNGTIDVTIAPNEMPYERGANINIYGTDADGEIVASDRFLLIQAAQAITIEFPAWKDTDIEIEGDGDYTEYEIQINNETVFSGRCYLINGNGKIRVNNILKDYIEENISIDVIEIQENGGYVEAELLINGMVYRNLKCWNDWSYDNRYNDILSVPISNVLDNRQLLPFSVKGGNTMTVHYDDADYFTIDVEGDGVCTTMQPLNEIDRIKFDYNGLQSEWFNIQCNPKNRYCLYYKNLYGGFDSFCFLKSSKESNKITNNIYKRYTNNTEGYHQTVQYSKSFTKSWKLQSRYLNDRQSEIFAKHLLSSNMCFLQDLESGEIYPVNITQTSSEFKLWSNNGRKPIRHDVTVELAQDRIVQ